MKKIILIIIVMLVSFTFAGCTPESDIASTNLSKAADMFELERRVVFYDAIQGAYLLSIEGRCSIEIRSTKLAVTCKTSDTTYKKHYLGLSDKSHFLLNS